MRRKIAAVGLALAAVLATGALLATGAGAANITASSYPATGTGEQVGTHVWTFQGQKVECTNAHFEGSIAAASSEIVITPKYTGCTAFGIANASVSMGSCTIKYTFGVTTLVGGTHYVDGETHTICTEGGSTTISAPATNPLCVVHLPPATPTVNKVDIENKGPGEMDFTHTHSGMHSDVTDIGGFFCPLTSNSTDTSGTYTGVFRFKGTGGKTLSIS